jgi:general nucleoside transport system permease protein
MTRPALPAPIEYGLIPLVNLAASLVVAAAVLAVIGADPLAALGSMALGAIGSEDGWGYTLYYATNFILTGLAVAVPFHAGLFNIGGEGQATIGGLGVALVCLGLGGSSLWLVLPLALLAAILFGAAWAAIPAWLQARRGSHLVITTIMFNFIAASLMTYLLVDVMIAPGQGSPETRGFDASTFLPPIHAVLEAVGIPFAHTPLNISIVVALAAAGLFWGFVWHTRWGYEIRAVGHNAEAARYGGVPIARVVIISVILAGGLAGLVAINEVMGVHHRLFLGFSNGYGFVGIAVALMGRNHPVGIVLAAILFGALYQGGTELAFDYPQITKEIVVVMEGLVILFCGALENVFRRPIEALFRPASAVAAR